MFNKLLIILGIKKRRRSPLTCTKGRRRIQLFLAMAIATLLLISLPSTTARVWGQIPDSPAGENDAPAEAQPDERSDSPGLGLGIPPEFDGILPTPWSSETIIRRPIRFDGQQLFQIGGQTQTDPGSAEDAAPVEDRARVIENRLRNIAQRDFDTDQLRVFYEESNGLPIIYVEYRIGNEDGETVEETAELMTVTTADAEANLAPNPQNLAHRWTEIIEDALIQFKLQRQSSFLIRQGQYAALVLLTMVVLSVLLNSSLRRLKRERNTLEVSSEEHEQALSSSKDNTTRIEATTTALLAQQKLANQQKRGLNELKQRALQLAEVGVWGCGIFLILGMFPYSRWLQPIIIELIKIPGKISVIVICAYVFIRFSSVLIDRFFLVLQSGPRFSPEKSQRRALRFATFSTVAKGVIVFLVGVATILAILTAFNIDVAPLVAGAGIVGLAISFAAQNLIKDVINGFLILLEDQYGVGDVVVLGDVAGFVEYMGLRITQLRNEEGRLITVPNSSITVVQNLTKEWSRVDMLVEVDHSADIDEAIAVIKDVANNMCADLAWKNLIIDAPLLLGVDQLNHVGATVRMWIKTQPLKQWDVGREYRRRLKIAFDKAGISIGVPQQSIRFNTSLNVQQPSISNNGGYAPPSSVAGETTYGGES
jgi:small-conductance mechanosensitive channel